MAPQPAHPHHHFDYSDRQGPVCTVASVHKNNRDNMHTDEPACGRQACCSDFIDTDKSQLYSRDQCNYTFSDSVSDNFDELYFENMNDKCNGIGNHDFSSENDREGHQMLNNPEHYLGTLYQISINEHQDEMVGTKEAFTTDDRDIQSSKKNAFGSLTPVNVLAIYPSERKTSIGTTNNSTQKEIIRKSNSSSFRNHPKTSQGKSKYTSAAILPPCRICGAKASGLHYGVNSCEACKGFFRRALKRPMVFTCSKSKRCDMKGNKRSTCRFCRYKKCLSLGMARESIKTGRYSYKKRTRDTIEVKRLQKLPNVNTSEPDLDMITKNILAAHDYLIVSTTDAPSDWLYQKQLEYHNIYLLHKQFGNHPELIAEQFADPSHSHDNSSRPSDNKDFQYDGNNSGQHKSPSRSVSQSSSDSGFVDEASANGCGAAISRNDHFSKHNASPKCTSHSKVHSKEQRTEAICVNAANQHDNTDVKKFEQNSTNKKIRALKSYKQECSLCQDTTPLDIDSSRHPFSGEDIQRDRNICCCEKNNQTNCGASFQEQNLWENADLEMIQDCKHSAECLSDNMFRDIGMIPLVDNGHGFVKRKTCAKRKTVISKDVSSRKCDDLHTNHSGSTTAHSDSSSDATLSNYSIHRDSSNCRLRYRSPDDTDIDDHHENTPGHTTAAKSISSMGVGTKTADVCDVGNCGTSLNVCGESDSEIAHRANTWIQGYIDFAKEIPGFSNLSYQDQSSLLKHAWDEVWLLGTYRGYNKALGVAMTPRGICAHADELEKAWGGNYSRFAFIMADMIKRYNLSRQLMVLLKAVCIVAPDRCHLNNAEKVSEIHWMVVSCLQRHAEKTHPGNCQIFPRLISILTSLRELSESAKRDLGTRSFPCDFNILSQTLMPF